MSRSRKILTMERVRPLDGSRRLLITSLTASQDLLTGVQPSTR